MTRLVLPLWPSHLDNRGRLPRAALDLHGAHRQHFPTPTTTARTRAATRAMVAAKAAVVRTAAVEVVGSAAPSTMLLRVLLQVKTTVCICNAENHRCQAGPTGWLSSLAATSNPSGFCPAHGFVQSHAPPASSSGGSFQAWSEFVSGCRDCSPLDRSV